MCPVQSVTHVSGRSLQRSGSQAAAEIAWTEQVEHRAQMFRLPTTRPAPAEY
jgi:hypothetical protein